MVSRMVLSALLALGLTGGASAEMLAILNWESKAPESLDSLKLQEAEEERR